MRMMKIRAVTMFTMFTIAQVAFAKQRASRRSANAAVEDRAIRCNQNAVAKQFVQHWVALREEIIARHMNRAFFTVSLNSMLVFAISLSPHCS